MGTQGAPHHILPLTTFCFFTCSSVVLIKVFPNLVFTSFVSLPYNCHPIRLYIISRLIYRSNIAYCLIFFSVYSPAFSTIKTWSNCGFVDCQLSIVGILFNLYLLFKFIHSSAVSVYLVLNFDM